MLCVRLFRKGNAISKLGETVKHSFSALSSEALHIRLFKNVVCVGPVPFRTLRPPLSLRLSYFTLAVQYSRTTPYLGLRNMLFITAASVLAALFQVVFAQSSMQINTLCVVYHPRIMSMGADLIPLSQDEPDPVWFVLSLAIYGSDLLSVNAC